MEIVLIWLSNTNTPATMHIKPFEALYPNFKHVDNIEETVLQLKENFSPVASSKLFKKLSKPSLLVYQIKSPDINSTGIICLTNIKDYEEGHILKHENTLEEKEKQQLDMFEQRKAIIKPALLTYPDHEWFGEYLEKLKSKHKPLYSIHFSDRQQDHKVWAFSSKKVIDEITHFFSHDILTSYIADGHHRFATYARFHRDKAMHIPAWIMTIYIPFSGLRIYEFNRIFTPLKDFNITSFTKKLSEVCFIEKIPEAFPPKFKYHFLVTDNKSIYSCVWKPSVLQEYHNEKIILDTSLLNKIIFREILGVQSVRADERIKYIEGFKGWEGMKKALDKYEKPLGFYLHPVSMEEFQKVSDEHLILPPKSTWFEPRIRNGLLIHDFNS